MDSPLVDCHGSSGLLLPNSSDNRSADRDTAHESLGNVYVKGSLLLCLVFGLPEDPLYLLGQQLRCTGTASVREFGVRTMRIVEDRVLFDSTVDGYIQLLTIWSWQTRVYTVGKVGKVGIGAGGSFTKPPMIEGTDSRPSHTAAKEAMSAQDGREYKESETRLVPRCDDPAVRHLTDQLRSGLPVGSLIRK